MHTLLGVSCEHRLVGTGWWAQAGGAQADGPMSTPKREGGRRYHSEK